jgi:hypothetical protein
MKTPSFDLLVGLEVSHTWLGDYSSLYLELGELTAKRRKDGTAGNPEGEITVYAGFGWRVERPRSILGGNKSGQNQWSVLAKKLEGAVVLSAELTGRVPELSIRLSKGFTLATFAADRGQPQWTISFNKLDLGHLCVRNGHLSHDQQ